MNLQSANFEDLLATYYEGTAAHVGAEHLSALIRDEQYVQLAELLRDHRKRAITAREEIRLRRATDRLMSCCSVLEIASLMGFVSEIRPTDFGMEISRILEDKYVRRYYEEFYPTKLPQLFRCRLTGSNSVIEKVDCTDLMLEFLALDRLFMEKLDDGILLRMLDSFTIEGLRFRDVVELIGKPEEFINCLLLAPEKRDVRARALYEFSLFMQFCFDLRQLLARTEPHPLLQSALWNNYSYWFVIIGEKLSERLGEALSQFLKWNPEGRDSDTVQTVQSYVSEALSVLKDLTSPSRFAEPIDTLLLESTLETTVDDVINVSGHGMGTAEIESALTRHVNVAEAAVVGFPHDVKGEDLYAYVILKTGVEGTDALKKELVAHVRKEIGPIASLGKIQFVSGLPKTRSGKIARRILRKVAAGAIDDLGDTSTLAKPAAVDDLSSEGET